VIGHFFWLCRCFCRRFFSFCFDEGKQMSDLEKELVAALELALRYHGIMFLSDPPQDAWKAMNVEPVARAAIARAKQQAEPVALTDAEIEQMNAQWSYEIHGDRTRYLVRMTEKAHGIGKEMK
jgi:hypothetical protein